MTTTVQRQVHSAGGTHLELARQAASGDTAAFTSLVRANNRRLYRAARSILRDDAEAEETLQESYLLAYEGLSSFRGDSSVATWLTRIVINQALGRLRKRKRKREIDTTDLGNVVDLEARLDMAYKDRRWADVPERTAIRRQTCELLQRRIDELPAAFRIVFVMRALDEIPAGEIAQCLGIEESTVRTRYLRARRLLRKSLATDMGGALDEVFAFDGERCDRTVTAVLQRIESVGARPDAGPPGP
jgi:RNA polymerase sigma-70 factor (ECF subfamily)